MSERIAAADVLAWYRDAGVDEPLAAEPVDRFAQSEAIASERAERKAKPKPIAALAQPDLATSPPRKAPPALSADAAVREATQISEQAGDLAALRTAIEAFEGCGLKGTARTTVFAAGEPAKLAVVSDVPDRDEDAEGTPFAGPAGAMLERMLQAIGISAAETYRLCASPWRTPGQRQLTPQEKTIVAPFLARHLELARPELILLMGGAATELALGPGKRMTALRGRWTELPLGDRVAGVVCTFHPNFLMRQPEQKRLAWADLLRLKERL